VTKLTKRNPGEQIPSNNTKASPAETYVRSLNGEYYLLGEVAEILGVAKNTLRRLVKSGNINAPSFTANLGKMSFYVFSKADLEEIREYYQSKYEDFSKGEGLPVGRPRARKK
jgi:excisionase family DNA binding protein